MARKIITIGFDIPGFSKEYYHDYSSDQSLLDADLIIFEPTLNDYTVNSGYRGKSSYSENESFKLQEAAKHWRQELSIALENGKTVFIFFSKFEEIFVQTGEKEYQGSGRSASLTNYVVPYDNYKFFPIKLPQLVSKGGKEILFNNNPIFVTFWNEFKNYIRYESYLDGDIEKPLFFTKTGKKPVGGIFKIDSGHLVLLPPLRYPDDFTEYDEDEKGEFWADKAIEFGKRLVQVLVEIDNILKGTSEATTPPGWMSDSYYDLTEVQKIKKQLSNLTTKIDSFTIKKNGLLQTLTREEELKNLVFEKGKPLENAILTALHILGYEAEGYNDGRLELDSIIISPEGDRFIGEAEGKDNAAINIDKFRQLESNIQEDLEKEDVKMPAIGILFGNGFRLTKPKEREEQFTKKCIANATRSNAILIKTADLFVVSKYIKEGQDKKFAEICRKSIKDSRGKIIQFPALPKKKIKRKKSE